MLKEILKSAKEHVVEFYEIYKKPNAIINYSDRKLLIKQVVFNPEYTRINIFRYLFFRN